MIDYEIQPIPHHYCLHLIFKSLEMSFVVWLFGTKVTLEIT